MNPLNYPKFAQDTHREYEAKYGSRNDSDEAAQVTAIQFNRRKVILALGGASLLGIVATLASLF